MSNNLDPFLLCKIYLSKVFKTCTCVAAVKKGPYFVLSAGIYTFWSLRSSNVVLCIRYLNFALAGARVC